jgi:hypothetical protein
MSSPTDPLATGKETPKKIIKATEDSIIGTANPNDWQNQDNSWRSGNWGDNRSGNQNYSPNWKKDEWKKDENGKWMRISGGNHDGSGNGGNGSGNGPSDWSSNGWKKYDNSPQKQQEEEIEKKTPVRQYQAKTVTKIYKYESERYGPTVGVDEEGDIIDKHIAVFCPVCNRPAEVVLEEVDKEGNKICQKVAESCQKVEGSGDSDSTKKDGEENPNVQNDDAEKKAEGEDEFLV